MTQSTVLHLLPLSAYRCGIDGPISSSTLDTEGFVHCSPDVRTTLAVANALYRSAQEPMIALELDTGMLSAPLRWEAADPAPPPGVSGDVLFPHVYGPLDRSAVTGVYYARRDVSGGYLGLEQRGPTAEALDLLPHPEGGWYRRTWTSPVEVSAAQRLRPTATAIHFLLPAGQESAWHTVASDELWFWHRGGPLTLFYGGDGDEQQEKESVTLGGDVRAGQVPQAVVPAGTWQRAAASSAEETLVSCTVSPGFDFADFRTR